MDENKPQLGQIKGKIAEREEKTLAFWNEKNIFQKSLEKKSPKGEFVFYDGPPFATGQPHFGHLLPTSIKDAVPRFKTMQGYHVSRRWGWDCHGLPVENLVEKELGLKSKKDILDYGIEKFNEKARESVVRYKEDWKNIIPRLGRWADMENDYETMESSYTESVWWAFKTLYSKGLIYEGFKAMQLCPRCGTTLSNFEVNQGYKDVTDISVFVEFELIDNPNTYLLAWTTTPWTLPGNAALAVNKEVTYVKVSSIPEGASSEKYFILAKERLEEVFKDKAYTIVQEFKGAELVDLHYNPVFHYYADDTQLKNREHGWKIYNASFVTTEDGTGIVHIAPAYGEDDLNLAQKNNIPIIWHVDTAGKFKKEVVDFAEQLVKPKDEPQKADIEIIKYLAGKGLLFAKKKIIHSYPHCWRCETPLLNYAASSWFVKVTQIKDRLVSENKKIKWVPPEIGEGRFGKWLEGARDWAISRSRFWGAPLPVWKCEKCEKMHIAGAVSDIQKAIKPRNNYFVVRHGEAENNVAGIMSTEPENPHHLTEKGKKQVEGAAKNLIGKKIDLIFASPFLRTKETAQLLADSLTIPKEHIIIDDRIREIKGKTFNGKSVAEYHNYFQSIEERFTKKTPEGEDYTDIKIRMGEFIYDIDRKFEGKNILIVTHDSPAWLLFSAASGFNTKEALVFRGVSNFFIENGHDRELHFKVLPRNKYYEIDLHRPFIDEVVLSCSCGGNMKRVPEVFDCWFESGSMPYAEAHYPFENLEKFNPTSGLLKRTVGFPADFIAEGLDQTRGWFYSMLVLSVALFGKAAYKNVVVNGLILAEDGRKMSKSLKNYPDLLPTVDKYGADAMRYYLLSSPAVSGGDFCFSEKGVQEVMQKVLMRLDNVLSFYKLYAPSAGSGINGTSSHVLDKWIIARLNELISEVTTSMEKFELDHAVRPIGDFVDDLSVWYIRRARDRFKAKLNPADSVARSALSGFRGEDEKDKKNALETTRFVLLELSKIMAPFMPFFAEYLFGELKGKDGAESVHLESWPKLSSGGKSEAITADMQEVRKIVSLALEARAKAGIKVRQPLASLKFSIFNFQFSKDSGLIELIKDEVNVKSVLPDDQTKEIELDLVITPELKEEGRMRELVRTIQELRKNEGLSISDNVSLTLDTNEEGKRMVEKYKSEIQKTTLVKNINFGSFEGEDMQLDGIPFKLKIQR